MRKSILGFLLLAMSLPALALKTTAPADSSIEGHWAVNVGASEDGEALLAKRMEDKARYEAESRKG